MKNVRKSCIKHCPECADKRKEENIGYPTGKTKGKTDPRTGEIVEYQYKCEKCGYLWHENTVSTAVDRNKK